MLGEDEVLGGKKKSSFVISGFHVQGGSIVQIMHGVRKSVNKCSLWPWYVKLAKCVSSPRWSTYASNCHSTECFSDNRGPRGEASAQQVGSAHNMQIKTLTMDSSSQP